MHAETAYVFRHALVQSAAYELQTPTQREQLHYLAFQLLEQVFGGRAPEPPPLSDSGKKPFQPHPSDPFADELAGHLHFVGTSAGQVDDAEVLALTRLYVRRAAEFATQSYRNDAARCHWAKLFEILPRPERAEALRMWASVETLDGDNRAARTLLLRALEELHHAPCKPIDGAVLTDLVASCQNNAEVEAALDWCQRALVIHREHGSPHLECTTLKSMGGVFLLAGRHADAEIQFDAAMAVAVRGDLKDKQAGIRAARSVLLQQLSRYDEAEAEAAHALKLAQELNDTRTEALALVTQANLFAVTRRFDDAEKAYTRALALYSGFGARAGEAVTLMNLANILSSASRRSEAASAYDRALTLSREIGHRRYEGGILGNQAELFFAAGQLELAEETFRQALAIHHETGNPRSEGYVHRGLARIMRALDRHGEAESAFSLALALSQTVGNRWLAGDVLCERAIGRVSAGLVAEAHEDWRKGSAILSGLGHTEELEGQRNAMREACAAAGVRPFDDPADEGAP